MVDLVGESTELPLEEQTIVLAGLQGSGKTTSAAKMAWWFSKKGLRPAVIQTDTFRPGAYEQAEEMCERAEVDFYGDPDAEDPVEIARAGLEATEGADVRIVDTSGRSGLNEELVEELKRIETAVDPDRNLLVLDAAIGQGAKDQARAFGDAVGIEAWPSRNWTGLPRVAVPSPRSTRPTPRSPFSGPARRSRTSSGSSPPASFPACSGWATSSN